MTEEQLKDTYLRWIEHYCNNEFDKEELPAGVELALDSLTKIDPLDFSVSSAKLSDMSQTFSNDGDIPRFIYNWLKPYRKIRW